MGSDNNQDVDVILALPATPVDFLHLELQPRDLDCQLHQ
jgi:hypothetical protein